MTGPAPFSKDGRRGSAYAILSATPLPLRPPWAAQAAVGSCVAAPCLGVLYSSELGLRGQEEGEGKEVKGEEKEAKR